LARSYVSSSDFCFRSTRKGLTLIIFTIYQELTKPDHRPVHPVMKKAISGSDKHIQRLLSVWMPSMYPECRRHSENELGAERLIELFVFTVKSWTSCSKRNYSNSFVAIVLKFTQLCSRFVEHQPWNFQGNRLLIEVFMCNGLGVSFFLAHPVDLPICAVVWFVHCNPMRAHFDTDFQGIPPLPDADTRHSFNHIPYRIHF